MTSDGRPSIDSREEVAIYFKPSWFDKGRVVEIASRPVDAGELSCDRLGLHGPNLEAAKQGIWRATRLPGRNKNGAFVIFDADALIEDSAANPHTEPLSVIADPLAAEVEFIANPAHALIIPIPPDPDPRDLYVSVFNFALRGSFPAFPPS